MAEYLIGLSISGLLVAALCAFSLYNTRSFAAYSSYMDLDLANRQALDQMTKDFRMVQSVTNFATNTVGMVDFDNQALQYTYNPDAKTLTRQKGASARVLLRNCERLEFAMNMRNMSNGTFLFYPATNIYECKAITVDWVCSRSILGSTIEDMPQTATIVIRN